jgi:hypothetical protein
MHKCQHRWISRRELKDLFTWVKYLPTIRMPVPAPVSSAFDFMKSYSRFAVRSRSTNRASILSRRRRCPTPHTDDRLPVGDRGALAEILPNIGHIATDNSMRQTPLVRHRPGQVEILASCDDLVHGRRNGTAVAGSSGMADRQSGTPPNHGTDGMSVECACPIPHVFAVVDHYQSPSRIRLTSPSHRSFWQPYT